MEKKLSDMTTTRVPNGALLFKYNFIQIFNPIGNEKYDLGYFDYHTDLTIDLI